MAASGYTPIQLYYSTTASAIPTAGNLANGELAINITDGKIYYKNNSGVVTLFGSTGDVSTISFGTTGLTPSTATGGAVTVAGTLVAANGGTGQSSYTTGDLIYASGSTALSKLAIGTNGYVLQSNGTAPAWVAASSVVGGAAGSNTQVQYNNSGALGASSTFTYDGTSLSVGSATVVSANDIISATKSGELNIRVNCTNTTNGANLILSSGNGTTSSLYSYATYKANQTSAVNWYTGLYGSSSYTINNGSDRLVIDSSGNVGIGRSTASFKLDVAEPYTSGDVYAGLRLSSNNYGYIIKGGIKSGVGGVLTFSYDNAGASAEVMRLDTTGNVGIGTSSPQAKLHVNGDSYIAEGNSLASYSVGYSGVTSKITFTSATPATNIQFFTMNSSGSVGERMRIDGSGNLGLGGTPSAWSTLTPMLQFGTGGSFIGGRTTTSNLYMGTNAYYNGTNWIYTTANPASYYQQGSGAHTWNTATTGSAGGTITWTQAMTLDASGNLGIGTSSPLARFHISSSSAEAVIGRFQSSGATAAYIGFAGSGAANTYDVRCGAAGTNIFAITTSDTERMRIDSSGNVGIGTSSPATKLNPYTDGSSGSTTELVRLTNGSGGGLGTGTSLTYYHSLNTGALVEGGRIAVVKEATWTTTASTQDANMQFWTTLDGTATERMRIDSSGNVGINTTTPTTKLDVAGSSSLAAFRTPNILEISTVSATAATGTINYDVTTQSVVYYTSNASGNFTLNFRGSSGTSLNTIMNTGDTVTVTFLCTNGGTAYYNSAVQVDGSSVTPKWLGGTAPTSGNASSVDAYTYAIIKTGSAAFTVLASQTKFA